MTDFGLAEMKCEGDTILYDIFNEFNIVRSMVDTGGMFYVIGHDNQPMIIVRQGVSYFLLHHDKNYAETKFRPSMCKKFINYIKSILND